MIRLSVPGLVFETILSLNIASDMALMIQGFEAWLEWPYKGCTFVYDSCCAIEDSAKVKQAGRILRLDLEMYRRMPSFFGREFVKRLSDVREIASELYEAGDFRLRARYVQFLEYTPSGLEAFQQYASAEVVE